jgi:predicted Ser/Thr protein kinase
MTISEVFEKYEPTDSDVALEALRKADIRAELGRDGVEDDSIAFDEEIGTAALIASERDFTTAEAKRFRAAVVRFWTRAATYYGDHERMLWSGIQKAGRIAAEREADETERHAKAATKKAAAEAVKPKTPRELEARLRAWGYSKAEARGIIAHGLSGATLD